jgi:hypothetical protein
MALELQDIGIGESFKAKPPDLTALEVCLKGAAFVCSRRSAQLVAKCHGGTFELPDPHRRLPSKVVSRRRMSCPRSCSLCSLCGDASFNLHYIVVAPPGCSGVSRDFLWSAWCKDMEAPTGHIG